MLLCPVFSFFNRHRDDHLSFHIPDAGFEPPIFALGAAFAKKEEFAVALLIQFFYPVSRIDICSVHVCPNTRRRFSVIHLTLNYFSHLAHHSNCKFSKTGTHLQKRGLERPRFKTDIQNTGFIKETK